MIEPQTKLNLDQITIEDNGDHSERMEIGGEVYIYKKRLPWLEQEKIDATGFRMFVSGQDMQRAGNDLSEVEEVELRAQPAEQKLARLRARLVNVNRRDIAALPRPHVEALNMRFVELEEVEEKEVAALAPENPTEKPSSASSTTP